MSSSRERSLTKRSDFAQKLLDDLRVRKERLAASQRSNQTNSIGADKYAYSSRSFKGSREIKAQNTGVRSGNMQNRYGGGNRSLTSGEASNQIVPFRQGQKSQKIDLSTALAFALENAGKATRIDPSGSTSIITFLHQMGRRSTDFGKMERRSSLERHQPSSSQLPMIHLHIKEISKGTQKLNQVIKACANGLHLGTYSIEYGKELLKGAIDLQQSLRMLVEIQEASDYMISHPQRKNRIKLLDDDEDEDEDDNTVKGNEEKQLELPRFSFDRPTRNYHDIQEFAMADIKMRLAALTYHPAETNINNRKQTTPNSMASSHTRSTRHSPDMNRLSRFQEQNNKSTSSQPKAEKGRIPNVIAKLMGLGELPEGEDSKYIKQKDSTIKTENEKAVSRKTIVSGTKETEKRIMNSDLASSNTKQKVIQANKAAALGNLVALQAGRSLVSRNIASNVVIREETQAWKDLNKRRSQKDILEKETEQGSANHIKRKDAEKVETKELTLQDGPQRMATHTHRRPHVTVEFQGETEYKPSTPRAENYLTDKLLLRSQKKPKTNHRFEQPLLFQKSQPRETKYLAANMIHYSEKERLQQGRQKGIALVPNRLPKPLDDPSDMKKKQSRIKKAAASMKNSPEIKDASQNKRFPEGSSQKRKPSGGSCSFAHINNKDSNAKCPDNISSSRYQEPQTARTDNPPEEKPVYIQSAQKPKEGKLHNSEIPQKINEVMTRGSGSLRDLTRPLKYQSSSMQEAKDVRPETFSSSKETKQMRTSRTKEAEGCTNKSNNSVSNIQPSNVNPVQARRNVKEDPLLCNLGEDESQSQQEVQTPPLTNSCQAMTLTDKNDLQAPEVVSDNNQAIKSREIVPMQQNGTEGGIHPSLASHEQQKLPKSEIVESLTEIENHLKKILIKSQLFVDTAEALFKLNKPLGILHAGGRDYHSQEDSNLILDCGYEIMKRKGRRQELSMHPFAKIPISSTKTKSLDDLVRQLNKELENLKSYGRDKNAEPVVECYLPKMLEIDVHYNNPDLNCMWDMGWDGLMFAFIEKDDVIRDTERYVINGLVDEIIKDFLAI